MSVFSLWLLNLLGLPSQNIVEWGLNNRNLFPHSSGGQKSKISVLAWLLSAENSPLVVTDGCLLAVSSQGGKRERALLFLPLLIRAPALSDQGSPVTSLTCVTSSTSLSPVTVQVRASACELGVGEGRAANCQSTAVLSLESLLLQLPHPFKCCWLAICSVDAPYSICDQPSPHPAVPCVPFPSTLPIHFLYTDRARGLIRVGFHFFQ